MNKEKCTCIVKKIDTSLDNEGKKVDIYACEKACDYCVQISSGEKLGHICSHLCAVKNIRNNKDRKIWN